MSVTALIPNWNGGSRLERVIADLNKQSHPVDKILVVDNGSTDGSPHAAQALGAGLLSLDRNYGFAVAINRGLLQCRSPLIAIINNDVELDRLWLHRLAEACADPEVWFATGKILKIASPGTIDGSFDLISRAACAWRAGEGRPDGPIWDQPRTIQMAPFTALVLRKELFDRLGGLDEVFESYLEDVDFGLRCAANGYTGRYVPAALARHAGSATRGRWNPVTVRQISRNQVLLLARHYPPPTLRAFGWAIATGQLLWGLVALRRGAGLAFVLGKIEGLRMFGPERRRGSDAICSILGSSERELRLLQHSTGFDWYWRIYFALAGVCSESS